MNEFREAQQTMKAPGMDGWWARADLTDSQWADLLEAAHARDISHRAIATVLGKWGVQVTPAQVGHWRRTHVR
jgi:hypothetical protein